MSDVSKSHFNSTETARDKMKNTVNHLNILQESWKFGFWTPLFGILASNVLYREKSNREK